MNRILTYAALFALPASALHAQTDGQLPCDQAVTVFSAGEGNPYSSIRIPAVTAIGDGKLMAIAEGRYLNTDQGKNDIIMSLSEDGGKTWSKPICIAASEGATFNNPCPVYDAKKNTTSIFFQRYPSGVSERQKNIPDGWKDEKCVRNFVIQSKDGGKTWTKPKDVTPTTKRPKGVDIMAAGPNAGIQIREGSRKGRLVIPMNEGPFGKWVVSCVYSDNGGSSWKIGSPTTNMVGMVNETAVAETDGGGLVLVACHWGGGNCRRITWSNNAGQSWSPVEDAKDLFCDSTQGSLLRYSFKSDPSLGGKSRLLFSGPGKSRRINGTVCMSYDNGKTWPVSKAIGNGGFAYSSLVPIEPGKVGVLYEENSNHIKHIKFAPVSIDWLTDGKDTGK